MLHYQDDYFDLSVRDLARTLKRALIFEKTIHARAHCKKMRTRYEML